MYVCQEINPMITDGIDCDISNASSINEYARDATRTPLPNAIMTAIVFLESFVVNASRHPNSRGILATNPHNRDTAILVMSATMLMLLLFPKLE